MNNIKRVQCKSRQSEETKGADGNKDHSQERGAVLSSHDIHFRFESQEMVSSSVLPVGFSVLPLLS
eukprot:m.55863 g.55863  ORF g.55863 m.55863 type:complete len:66 (+) comp12975_c0_seq2:1180-1377(+)